MQSAEAQSWYMRSKGTVRLISELPVLVLEGRSVDLIVGEINAAQPLRDFLPFSITSLSLGSLFDAFAPRRTNSVVRFVLPKGSVEPLVGEVYTWKRHPPRSVCDDEWQPDRKSVERDLSAIQKLAEIIRARLAQRI